ncbi:Repressed by EFG1 protein 1 [Sphaceloma murrayae]|uniref:Repressed by EFG1 protein 1 n=1 Tax=Sphaceloma murrayae TaxID=2082308 RepID=A0A2K1QZJ9_9PEZI|nr:Repressed by EFG1 protein 1 [Sphaceloma murrayae]
MRSSVLFTAAFAAVALASPVLDARGEVVVTDNEVVYVTELVTVTEGQALPTTSAAPVAPATYSRKSRSRKHRHSKSYASAPAPSSAAPAPSSAAPSPSSQAPAPAPSSYEQPTPEPSTEAPAPATTSYQAPAPEPTSAAPAPSSSSSEAPAPAPTGYTPVSIDEQAPLQLHQAQSNSPEAPAQAPAPQAPALHLIPIPPPTLDFMTPDCHAEEEPHLLKRGAQVKKKVATKAKAASKKKVAKTTAKAKSKATKAAAKAASSTSIASTTPKASSSPTKASSSSSSSSGTKTSSKPATGVATTYKQAVIAHHNYHRANHSSPDIAWDDALAATAKTIADTCQYGHSMNVDGGGYGQNIAAGIYGQEIGKVISDMFYNGEVSAFGQQYGQATPNMDNFGTWGHFSQIVWKATTKVGCATTDCTGKAMNAALSNYGSVFTVCNYKVAGNMQGAYGENIGESLQKPTIAGDYNVDQKAIAKELNEPYCPDGSTSRSSCTTSY